MFIPFLKKIIYFKEIEREKERERGKEKDRVQQGRAEEREFQTDSMLSAEPKAGLSPMTLTSPPEPKPGVSHLNNYATLEPLEPLDVYLFFFEIFSFEITTMFSMYDWLQNIFRSWPNWWCLFLLLFLTHLMI